jgi:hypothetical protein
MAFVMAANWGLWSMPFFISREALLCSQQWNNALDMIEMDTLLERESREWNASLGAGALLGVGLGYIWRTLAII